MRARALLALALVAAAGVAAESRAFSLGDPAHLLPDLAAGLALALGGVAVLALDPGRAGSRGSGALLLVTGAAWFAGALDVGALQLYRGPLAQLLLAYPGARPRSRLDVGATVAAYVAAIAPIWSHEAVAIAYPVVLAALVARGAHEARGSARRDRRLALAATGALAGVVLAGAIGRLTVSGGRAVQPALVAYDATLCAVAAVLAARLVERRGADVADLVVELGEGPAPTLRDGLARSIGDPELQLGYWSPAAGAYLDDAERALDVPPAGATRVATPIQRDGAPLAVLVHDRALLGDPALAEAVAAAAGLVAANTALRAEVRGRLDALAAARRRLLVAADDERRLLQQRLDAGPGRRLGALAAELEAVPAAYLGDAGLHLARTREDLRELARGLRPRELAEVGLAGALAVLAAAVPQEVEVCAGPGRFPAEVEATLFYVAAEALVNVVKHAEATRAEIRVAANAGRVRLVVADDGRGGAQLAGGFGLRGLADRVEALGGVLALESADGDGTRLTVDIPIAGLAS